MVLFCSIFCLFSIRRGSRVKYFSRETSAFILIFLFASLIESINRNEGLLNLLILLNILLEIYFWLSYVKILFISYLYHLIDVKFIIIIIIVNI